MQKKQCEEVNTRRNLQNSSDVNELKKSKKGVTLIALVVTIIVLLILAVVSFNAIAGEDGILERATTARLKSREADAEEKIKLKLAKIRIDKEGKPMTLDDVKNAFKEASELEIIIVEFSSQARLADGVGVPEESIEGIDVMVSGYGEFIFTIQDIDGYCQITKVNGQERDKWLADPLATTTENINTQTTYKLKFDSNGGSTVATLTKTDNNSFTIPAEVPTRDGFVFDGWYENAELTGTKHEAGSSITVNNANNEITLYAKWTDQLTAAMIEFKPTDTSWKVTTVEDALDYLYASMGN